MKPQIVIFIGRSGSGKGTQAKWLKKYLEEKNKKVFHLESGEQFRKFIHERASYTSKLAAEINKEGKLQPQFLSVYIWANELVNNINEDTNILMDGTPRRLDEAKVLESAFDFYNRHDIHVIYLRVYEDESIQRLQNRGRGDDKDIENIKKRLEWFETDVLFVIDYYRSTDYYHFHEIDGSGEIETIHKRIIKVLETND